VSGKVFSTGQPLCVNRYGEWDGRSQGFLDRFGDPMAVVGLPLKSGEQTTGVIGLGRYSDEKPFDADEVEVVNRFAELASIALENARLNDTLQEELAERRAAEHTLREREEELRTLVDNLNVGVYRVTAEGGGRFLKVNRAAADLFGFDSTQPLEKVPASTLYEDPAERKRFLGELQREGTLRGRELRLKKRDGTPVLAGCTATVKRDEAGRIQWIDGIVEDIGERKRAEIALRESEARFRSLFEFSPQPIAFVEVGTGRIVEVNERRKRKCRVVHNDRLQIGDDTFVDTNGVTAINWGLILGC